MRARWTGISTTNNTLRTCFKGDPVKKFKDLKSSLDAAKGEHKDVLNLVAAVFVVGFVLNFVQVRYELDQMGRALVNLVALLALVGMAVLTAYKRSQKTEKVAALKGQALLDRDSYPVFVGSEIRCVDSMSFLSKGKKYIVTDLVLTMDRVAIIDDSGKLCHAQVKRFAVTEDCKKR